MSGPTLVPEFDGRLVEAVVLAAIGVESGAHDFHAERETLYGVADPDARDAAFALLHGRWFEQLGLDRPFTGALTERPEAARGCGRWLVGGAAAARDEAADLLVGASALPVLAMRLQPTTVAAPERLWLLLRRELLHIADLLAPEFAYTAALPEAATGGPRERIVRDNYRVVWDTWVDGRLVREGRLPATARQERRLQFARVFPGDGDAAFDRFFESDSMTHAALAAFAAESLHGPRRRCPLCDLPGDVLVPADLPAPVLAAIRRDSPAWRPADGACARCAEVYAVIVAPLR